MKRRKKSEIKGRRKKKREYRHKCSWSAEKKIKEGEKQGRIHDIRCVLILHYAIFSDFYKSVTDGRTDGHTLL